MIRDTSLYAYEDIKSDGSVGKKQKEVYDYLLTHSDKTDQEICRGLGYTDRNIVSPRRNELFKKGIIINVGKRLCTVRNRLAIVWRIKK